MDKVFFEDASMKFMERSLDLAVQRHGLLSANIANVDTPGFKTVDINFEEELKKAIQPDSGRGVTSSDHFNAELGKPSAAVVAVEGLTERNDLNNVNIDREMSQVSTNAMKFSMAAQLLAGKFRTLRSTINEGR
jgi:flagellar basal-body rod protein FlgB